MTLLASPHVLSLHGFLVFIAADAKLMLSLSQLQNAICLSLCLALCSCGTQEVPSEVTAVKPVVSSAKPNDELKNSVKPDTKAAATPTDKTTEPPSEEPAKVAYEPPYPDRDNLFLAPKRSAKHKNTPGTIEQSVELLGFANVIGPRVILSINGNVVPMSEGGRELGIEVISIQPPAVVLQRDRERWQATLEN
ncbi:MAG: hypothetical protein SH868_00375 [Bythopirellula sp.]|nr:hypothetical protein [Bythopirellula sp.]